MRCGWEVDEMWMDVDEMWMGSGCDVNGCG